MESQRIPDAVWRACGKRQKNLSLLFLEIAFASPLSAPGKWTAQNQKDPMDAQMNRQCSKLANMGSLLYNDCKFATTALLSHLKHTAFPFHSLPHMVATKSIGINSFIAIEVPVKLLCPAVLKPFPAPTGSTAP